MKIGKKIYSTKTTHMISQFFYFDGGFVFCGTISGIGGFWNGYNCELKEM